MTGRHCRWCGGGAVDLATHEQNCVMRPDQQTFEQGVKRQAERLADAHTYRPRYPVRTYLEFMRREIGCFSITANHPQDVNRPEAYTLFTVASQHVAGDSLEELLDKAIDETMRRRGHL